MPQAFAHENSTDASSEIFTQNAADGLIENPQNVETLKESQEAIYVSTDGNDNNNGSESAPYATIYRAVNVALDSGITDVYVKEGTYRENSIPIETSLNIRGIGNVIIDAEQTDRIFKIDGEYEVELSNLTLINGVAPMDGVSYDIHETVYYAGGGAISIINAYVKMDHMTFINNAATEFGGAINVEAQNCIIANSKFISNYADVFGGAIDFEDDNCSIINCTFINNEAGNGGAVGCIAAACSIIGSYFENNTAENGAAIFIENDYLTGDDSNSHLIFNNRFYHNEATQQGGAIEVENQQMSENADWTLIDSNEFIENYAYNGGAISAYYGDAGIKNNVFINNTAGFGGAIAAISSTDSAYIIIGGLYLKNNTIINCTAEENGNAIYNMGYIGTEVNITFNEGKTVYCDDGKAVILNVSLCDDMGNPISGSPIDFTVNGNPTINPATDLYEGKGSVRFVPRQNGTLTVSGLFKYRFNAKAINLQTSELVVKNAIADYFGTIYVSDANGDDDNTGDEMNPVKTFNQAYVLATRSGGSFDIVINSGTYDVAGYTIERPFNLTGIGNPVLDGKNKGTLFSLYGGPNDEFHITGITFANGLADPSKYAGMNEGGAIFFKGGKLYLEDDTFQSNYASDYGGAVHINKGMDKYGSFYRAFAYINNCTFTNNNVKYFGGAISLYDSDVYVTNSYFTSNNAIKKGGAISILNGMANLTVINSTFDKNTANETGGAIDAEALNTYNVRYFADIFNSTFTSNSAKFGGAVMGLDSNISGCIFKDNTAVQWGGAVHFNDTTSVIRNSIFENNHAEEGSSYYGYSDDIISNFWGASFYDSDEISRQNIVVIKNDTESRSWLNPVVVNDTHVKSWINIEISGPGDVLAGKYEYEIRYVLNDGSEVTGYVPSMSVYAAVGNSANSIDKTAFEVSNVPVSVAATLNASDAVKVMTDYRIIATKDINVHAKMNTTIAMDVKTYSTFDRKTIEATLRDSEGNPLANRTLSIAIGNETYNLTTDSNGSVSMNVDLPAGAFNVLARFMQEDYFEASEASTTVNVLKVNTSVKAPNKSFTVTSASNIFTVTLMDENTTPVANRTVTIKINGKSYNRTTDANGQASLKISLPAKSYGVFVEFKGDDGYASSNATSKVTVNKEKSVLTAPKKTFKKSAKTKKLTVTLKSASKKAIAKKKVTVKVNGKTYTAKTNSKGQATFKVKLTAKKTYKYTVKFAGDSKYKAVTKTSTIKVK